MYFVTASFVTMQHSVFFQPVDTDCRDRTRLYILISLSQVLPQQSEEALMKRATELEQVEIFDRCNNDHDIYNVYARKIGRAHV